MGVFKSSQLVRSTIVKNSPLLEMQAANFRRYVCTGRVTVSHTGVVYAVSSELPFRGCRFCIFKNSVICIYSSLCESIIAQEFEHEYFLAKGPTTFHSIPA